MIITKLIGGLGNQMFQYAAGKGLACKYRTELKVDVSELTKHAENKYTQRHYELGIFNKEIAIANQSDILPFSNKNSNKIKRELQRRFPFLFNKMQAVESGSGYHPEFKNYPSNTYLNGFWQSELYFKDYESEVRKDFQFETSIVEACKPIINNFSDVNSVSLHIRRGDYVTNSSTNAFHGLCSPEYYTSAINYISNLQNNIEIFVFSDDISWCKENLKFSFPLHFIESDSAAEDLYLMSRCKHNIIANSSFSWWGAWLNNHADKIVVAPKQWFVDSKINTSDIIPSLWIKL